MPNSDTATASLEERVRAIESLSFHLVHLIEHLQRQIIGRHVLRMLARRACELAFAQMRRDGRKRTTAECRPP